MKVQLPGQMDPERIELLEEKTLFQGFFKLIQRKLRHPLFDGGMSEVVTREIFERGNAVVVLPYDPVRDEVVLIEQIRIPAIGNSRNPWLYELVAGMIDKQESILEVAERELLEETGLSSDGLTPIGSHLSSPGGCSERLYMVLALVDASKAEGIHGLDHEHEDIRVVVVPRSQAYQMVESGEIDNGSSVIGLQWLELNHHKLRRDKV
ncbi:ADP-ribose diphosphatase [Ferrimonas sp.]|uniref:ADP-ribose diphosphatase n=1 Tax=Ferrimonas sp. TaxID=2080861 RepID=UPI003A915ADD